MSEPLTMSTEQERADRNMADSFPCNDQRARAWKEIDALRAKLKAVENERDTANEYIGWARDHINKQLGIRAAFFDDLIVLTVNNALEAEDRARETQKTCDEMQAERDEADANAHQWHAAADLATKENVRLHAALEAVQWSEYDEGGSYCQQCNGDPDRGHRAGCEIAAALAPESEQGVKE